MVLVACEQRTTATEASPVPSAVSTLAPYVSSTLLAAVGPDGLLPTAAPWPTDVPIISSTMAAQLAAAFLRQRGDRLRTSLEAEHGSAIDFEALRPAGRVVLAESPYDPATLGDFAPLRNHLGSYYVVTFATHGGVPAVALGVSANNTEHTVENGRVAYRGSGLFRGNEFRWSGVPRGVPSPVMAPEAAVVHAFAATGARRATALRPPRRRLGASPWVLAGLHRITGDVDDDGRQARRTPELCTWVLTVRGSQPSSVSTVLARRVSTQSRFVQRYG
jgi:hypothetical protein